ALFGGALCQNGRRLTGSLAERLHVAAGAHAVGEFESCGFNAHGDPSRQDQVVPVDQLLAATVAEDVLYVPAVMTDDPASIFGAVGAQAAGYFPALEIAQDDRVAPLEIAFDGPYSCRQQRTAIAQRLQRPLIQHQ